jgi:hypothetical protein
MLKFMVIGLFIWVNNFALASDPCKDTIAHTPRADVAYNSTKTQSSFDLIGGPSSDVVDPLVKPKDDNKVIKIPLNIKLADRYGIDVPTGMDLESNFGTIAIYKNGDVTYNGSEISGDIKDACDHGETSENSDNTNTGAELPGVVSGGDQGE